MKLHQSTCTSSLIALLSLLSSTLAADPPAANSFAIPAPKGAAFANYEQNTKLNVTFNNKLDDPYISLFCSYIRDRKSTSPRSSHQSPMFSLSLTTTYNYPPITPFLPNHPLTFHCLTAIVIERVKPGETFHPLTLDYGPQKSCYISIQKGNGPPPPENSPDAFVSALFGITPDADPYAPQDQAGGGTDAQNAGCACSCESQCESVCSSLGFTRPTKRV